MLSPSQVEWNCPECEVIINGCHKYGTNCQTMLMWTCVASEKSGLYSNYYRHRQRCNYCAPELEEEREQLKDKCRLMNLNHLMALPNKCLALYLKLKDL
mgnify:CR=1 FL=1